MDEHHTQNPASLPRSLQRFVLIGDAGAGKTTLHRWFAYGTPSSRSKTVPTVGVEFAQRQVAHRGSSTNIHVWDTAGQERFLSDRSAFPRSFFRHATGVMLVFDVTNPKSLEAVPQWLQLVHDATSDRGLPPALLLVGTKADACAARLVPRCDAEVFAMKHALPYAEVSGATGDGVDDAFRALLDRCDCGRIDALGGSHGATTELGGVRLCTLAPSCRTSRCDC